MKTLLICAVLLLTLVGCKDDGDSEVPTTTLPAPTTTLPEVTTTTLAPTTTTLPPALGEHCKPAKFYCGNPVWWGLSKCGVSDDGDVFFSSQEAMLAQWTKAGVGSCVRTRMLDGTDQMLPVVGFGPCIPCVEKP